MVADAVKQKTMADAARTKILWYLRRVVINSPAERGFSHPNTLWAKKRSQGLAHASGRDLRRVSVGIAMAEIPIFNKNRLSSVLAVMAFPDDMGKASICACWLITQTVPDVLVNKVPAELATEIVEKATQFAYIFDEWRNRAQEGVFVGQLTNTLVSMIKQDRPNASWERAINFLIDNWKEAKLSRSSLYKLRGKYSKVYHLWGAFVDLRDAQRNWSRI